MPDSKPLTNQQVIALVREAACRPGFSIHPRCQDSVQDLGYDLARVRGLLAGCDESELVKHEPDDKGRPCHIVEFDILDYDQPEPFYVKVSLRLPDLRDGYLLSFKRKYGP
jgi:hypothetical protein